MLIHELIYHVKVNFISIASLSDLLLELLKVYPHRFVGRGFHVCSSRHVSHLSISSHFLLVYLERIGRGFEWFRGRNLFLRVIHDLILVVFGLL